MTFTTEERAVAIERGRGAPDDFHALEHGRVEAELRADLGLPEDVVVYAVAVDEQKDAGCCNRPAWQIRAFPDS
jgi:predicted O-linked N-acetylglucosamine transferase (SPINDLY family)